jgi:hypothetical protein
MSRYPASAPVDDLVLLFLPPCSPHLIPFGHRVHRAEPTCLSTPQRPRKAKTFRTRSSPTPTQIKPQPAPAILGHESVHTMLSITHHTRERPSTDPQTLRSSDALVLNYIYNVKCWLAKRRHVQKLSVAEMRMFCWLCEHTRSNRV